MPVKLTIVYVVFVLAIAAADSSGSTPEQWLERFGRDDFVYPDWIQEQSTVPAMRITAKTKNTFFRLSNGLFIGLKVRS